MFTNWDPNWPQRFGITAVGYLQTQDYEVDSANIMLGALPVPATAIGEIENEVTQIGLKADAWILPFWNVHVMAGKIDGQTDVTPATPILPAVEVNYDGEVYGIGTTLAYGQDHWWASVTGVMTKTELNSGGASVDAWILSPKVGISDGRFEFWLGATYQNVDEQQQGVFPIPGFGAAVYDISLEAAEAWNAQVGLRYAITESMFLTVEAGFGNRMSGVVHLEYRFW